MVDFLDIYCKFYDKFIIYIFCFGVFIWILSKKKNWFNNKEIILDKF